MIPDNHDNITEPGLPPLRRDQAGRIDVDSVPDVIQWFIDHDNRVAIIRHPKVEEVFQWKQELSRNKGENIFAFNCAEDRLAIGVIQSLAENTTRAELHSWISQLLNALDSALKANEATVESYGLELQNTASIVREAEKIPSLRGRNDFLINCWIETLCTAEARILGWLYKEFYGQPFTP